MEEFDERAFLFGEKRGANAHHFALGATSVYEDLLGALHWLEIPGRPLGVRCFFGDLLPNGRELSGGDDHRGIVTPWVLSMHLTLILHDHKHACA